MVVFLVIAAALLETACARTHAAPDVGAAAEVTASHTAPAEPASAAPTASTVAPAPGAPPPSAEPAAPPPPTPSATLEHTATNEPVASEAEPPLRGADGNVLPQTEERPTIDSPSFRKRIELLVEAIVEDRPELAHAAFFPLLAYEQVKAVAKPERDYRFRLLRAFDRDIHEYHQSLGRDAASAKLSTIEVNEAAARWMKPGSEGNRLGYYRVLRSRLRFDVAGRQRDLEVTSMISWRGEWYVVHLHGFE